MKIYREAMAVQKWRPSRQAGAISRHAVRRLFSIVRWLANYRLPRRLIDKEMARNRERGDI